MSTLVVKSCIKNLINFANVWESWLIIHSHIRYKTSILYFIPSRDFSGAETLRFAFHPNCITLFMAFLFQVVHHSPINMRVREIHFDILNLYSPLFIVRKPSFVCFIVFFKVSVYTVYVSHALRTRSINISIIIHIYELLHCIMS